MIKLLQNLRVTWRSLIKTPGFLVITLLTLAIGIGANSAIFSFVHAILLRPLPYEQSEQLVVVFENHRANGWNKFTVGAPILAEWRRQATVFEGLAARGGSGFILTGRGQPENLAGSQLSANIFSLLRIKPLFGRDFLPEEETFGKHQVALLSYEFWQRRFGGETNVVGRTLTLNALPYTVVGIMPPRTFFPEPKIDLWTPLAFSPDQIRQRHAHNYLVYGRLKKGVTLAQARQEMDVISQRMAQAEEQNKGWGAAVHSLQEIIVGDSRHVLLVLLASVGLVLLIGCANIANLLLVRSAGRLKEFAIRAAMGAERRQLLGQLLTESLFLAALGAIAGLLLAFLGVRALVHFSPPDLPRVAEGVALDRWTLLFTAGVTVLTGLLFGLVPAWQASNPALIRELNETSRGTSSSHHRKRFRALLVVGEVALSLALLLSAALMIRSFGRVVSQEVGFRPEHLITFGVGLPDKKYPEDSDRMGFYNQLIGRIRAIPGVQEAACVLGLPLSGQNSMLSVHLDDAPPARPGEAVAAGYAQVSPGYFRAMQIPFVAGRDFSEADRTNSPPVVIVDETFVKNFKLGTRTIGRRMAIGDGTEHAEVIGVVKDIKRIGMIEAPRGEMYRSYQQRCWGFMTLVLRTQRDPGDVTRAVRAELDQIDKDQPLEHVRTMTQLVSSSIAARRLSVQLLAGFAGVALLLAALGLYGVLAYNMAQRTQEIGIRLALGAQPAHVLRLVLRQGMALAGLGIGLGLIAGFILSRNLRALLFGISPNDPLSYLAVSGLLGFVALLACVLPARRATRVDPMVALRCE